MKDPVADFWGNIECALDQGGFRYILEDLVSKVRTELDGSSMTAQSIDRHDPYSDIATIKSTSRSTKKLLPVTSGGSPPLFGRLQPSRCLASCCTWKPLSLSGGTGASSVPDSILFLNRTIAIILKCKEPPQAWYSS